MEYTIKLHEDKILFTQLLNFSANTLNIRPEFVEKDYWLTRALQRMAHNENIEKIVFKGGTSLSKAYRLTNRFSEDIDIAVIDTASFSENQLEMLIKQLATDMASDWEDTVIPNVTSESSRLYKVSYQYKNLAELSSSTATGQLLIEINTDTNPYPYIKQEVSSFLADYLLSMKRQDLVEKYELKPFSINVLDKRRTIVEKLVSLIRLSFEDDAVKSVASKIRYFYDLYYLAHDAECAKYLQSSEFKNDVADLLIHDQQKFDRPEGWKTNTVKNSPLVKEFPALWTHLKLTYKKELEQLAFSKIPKEKSVADSFIGILKKI